MHLQRILIPLAIVGGLAACVEKGPPGKKIDPAYIKANLLSAEPTDLDNVVNADFDGRVIYLGNKVGTKVLTAGGSGSITHFWKVVEAPGGDWRIFTHLNGGPGEWSNLDATDMRAGYPPGKWKAGDIIRDEQKFSLDGKWSARSASMTVGLYRKGGQGADARMPIKAGPKDKEGRAPVFRFSVTGIAPAADAKKTTYMVRKATAPIVIDGKADEEAWKNAPMSPGFTDTIGGAKVKADTSARLLWDDKNLYAFIEVSDSDVFSQYKNQDDPLWKEDVVELFIDADGNRRGYVELQVNPNNAHFDAWFPKNRGQKHHFEWNSSMTSAVVVRGTNDDRGDRDQGWDVEIAIPISDVMGMDSAMKINNPPKLGDKWRLNVVRIDVPKSGQLAAASWNPITVQDFHALGRMLTVVFVDSDGNVDPLKAPAKEAVAPAEVPPVE